MRLYKIIFSHLIAIITLPIFFHINSFAISSDDVLKNKSDIKTKEKNTPSPLSVLATTSTTGSGNWSNTSKWSGAAIPGTRDLVTVNNTMTLDTSITIDGGGYYTINSPVAEVSGGYQYSLTLNGTGASNGVLEVKSTMTFEGAANINSRGKLIVRNGATLTLGPTTFANNSVVQVDAGGTLIINGTLTNNNNSNNITINGNLIVNGDFSGGTGSAIVGTGDFNATGGINTSGSGTVFGSQNDCTSNCSGNTLCSVTNTITADQSICSTVAASALAGSTVGSATYLWESSATGLAGSFSTASGTNNGVNYSPGTLSSTTYYRRQVISGGCTSKSNNVKITVTTTLPVSVSIASSFGGTSLCNGSPVTFTATVTNGGATPTYQWKKGGVNIVGANSSTYSTTFTSGSYAITCQVSSSLSCTTGSPATSNTLSFTVSGTAPAAPTGTSGGSVCGSGSASLTVSGGQTHNWYAASSGGSLLGTGSPFSTPSISTTTTFYVATLSAGCEGPRTAVVATVNSLPTPSISASGSLTLCQGFSVILTSSSGNSYTWAKGGTNISGATLQTLSVSAAGSYTVTTTDGNGCQGTSTASVVKVNSLPTAPTITSGGSTTFCSGGSVSLTSSSASAYLWSNGANTQGITASTSGSYTVTITDANGCKNTSLPKTVTVNVPLVPTITADGPTSFCPGGSVTLTSSSGTTYTWSNGATSQSTIVSTAGSYSVIVKDINNCLATSAATPVTIFTTTVPTITAVGATSFCPGGSVLLTSSSPTGNTWSNGSTLPSTVVSTGGSYSVTVKDGNNCLTTSLATPVTVYSTTIPTITAGSATSFCPGGSVTLTSSSATGNVWSNGATTSSTTVSTAGTYTVTVTDGNNCQTTSLATPVTVYSTSIPTITSGSPTSFCPGESVTLTSSSATGNVWSNGATTSSTTVSTAGTYMVTVTDGNNCQTTSLATPVTVYSTTIPTITAVSATSFCPGGSVTLTSSSATGNVWSNGATTSSTTVSTAGTYTVTVTDGNNCQTTSLATPVTVYSTTIPTITAVSATSFCPGESVTLTSSSATGNVWSNGATTSSTTVSTAGSYTVTVTDGNNCQTTSLATPVTVFATTVPTITAGSSTTFCQGGSVNLTSSAATSYTWSTGATSSNISVSAGGTYMVTTTDANGCQQTSLGTSITVNALPAVPNISASGPTTFCTGGSVDLSSSSASSYLWSNGATTQSITANASGIFSVTITDANGCQSSSGSSTVSLVPCTFTWTGANNSDWNVSGNWDKGIVPASFDDITIPLVTSPAYYPLITGSIAYRSLTINTGATFTVNNGATLTTTGDFIKNGTYVDNGGTILFSGSSIQNIYGVVNFKNVTIDNTSGVILNNPTNISGTLTLTNGVLASNGNLNMILTTGSISYSASDNGSISGNMMVTKSVPSIKTHYVSSPLSGSTSADFYDDVQVINPSTSLTRLFSWDMPTQAWVGMYGTTTPLTALNGYSIFYPSVTASSVLDFTGTYSHNAVPGTLDYSSVSAGGFVLVGNPYPSTLDWTIVSGWVKSNINNSIYFWDAKNGRYATYVNGIGTNGGTKYIPSMQAFYVTTSVAGDVSIGINNNARVNNPNPSMWRTRTGSNTLKLTLSSSAFNDETIIRFDDEASDSFDGALDALKLKNPDLAPSLYTVTGNTEYSINTLSSVYEKTIPLQIEAGFSGTYTISQEELAAFDANYSLVLEDKLLKKYTDLKNENYTFSINPDQGINRFNLVYKMASAPVNTSGGSATVNIYGNGNTVNIVNSNLNSSEAIYSLYNSIGQLIRTANFSTGSGQFSDQVNNIQSGIYVVKVISGDQIYSSKIYLGND